MLQEYLQAIVTVCSLINPMICGAMFAQLEAGHSRWAQFKDATKVALTVLVILVLGALVGTRFLNALGVSLDAFMVGGGVVLAWMGFGMIQTISTEQKPTEGVRPAEQKPVLTPLILFGASPGTITGVIALAAAHTRLDIPVTALVAVGVGVGLLWLMMLLAPLLGRSGNKGEQGNLITPLMGLLVVAMGTQFTLVGLKRFWLESQ